METAEIVQIGEIAFLDIDVKIYHDPHAFNKDRVSCVWQARNPKSFYQGIMWRNDITGRYSYPEDAVVPEQTDRDREMLPKFMMTAETEITDDLKSKALAYLEIEYKRRNNL